MVFLLSRRARMKVGLPSGHWCFSSRSLCAAAFPSSARLASSPPPLSVLFGVHCVLEARRHITVVAVQRLRLTSRSTGSFARAWVWASFHSCPNPSPVKTPVNSNVRRWLSPIQMTVHLFSAASSFRQALVGVRARFKVAVLGARTPRAVCCRASDRSLPFFSASVWRCGSFASGALRHLATDAVLSVHRFLRSGRTAAYFCCRDSASAPNQSFNRKFCPGSGLGVISFLPKPKPGQNSG